MADGEWREGPAPVSGGRPLSPFAIPHSPSSPPPPLPPLPSPLFARISAPMLYPQLGHTGLTVSRLCLGCMSYGSPQWRPWVLDENAARPFFRRALECGIPFFDTAD